MTNEKPYLLFSVPRAFSMEVFLALNVTFAVCAEMFPADSMNAKTATTVILNIRHNE